MYTNLLTTNICIHTLKTLEEYLQVINGVPTEHQQSGAPLATLAGRRCRCTLLVRCWYSVVALVFCWYPVGILFLFCWYLVGVKWWWWWVVGGRWWVVVIASPKIVIQTDCHPGYPFGLTHFGLIAQ